MTDPISYDEFDVPQERLATLDDWIALEPLDAKREYMMGKAALFSTYDAPITLVLLDMMWDIDCIKQDLVAILEKGI